LSKLRVVPKNFGKPIEWHAAHEVVDVVDADVCREPPKDCREFEMGTAVQCCLMELPAAIGFPMGMLELMLHVK
jgi:hypothetical protein